MKRFMLIDGNAILHRAYHALPPLTAPDGTVVNAVYGFFSMFIGVIKDYKPEYVVVCFDRPKPTFRQELFVGYQQHRPKMADDFVPQILKVHEVLEKMKVTIFEVDGYEADDLIGTIAKEAIDKEKVEDGRSKVDKKEIHSHSSNLKNLSSTVNHPSSSIEVLIVSGDRDLLQLVNSHVKMLAPVVGLKNIIMYDEAKVEEKFGIKPAQIVDYKALVGDASDGYPGVAGIGPKTASTLLQKYETFENLYQNIGELAPKISEKLVADAEQATLAKKLATIVTDAPIQFAIAQCLAKDFDLKRAREAFELLGFNSLIKRLAELKSPDLLLPPTPKKEDSKQLELV